jgi:hypothetical protein
MSRAVLSILVTLPMLMPQGVCLRKFDRLGWLHRAPAPSPVHTERAEVRHPSSCRCGCQERAARDQDAAGGGNVVGGHRAHGGTPPQPQEPCCPAICKSKLDKIVQLENPQPCGEVAFVGFAPVLVTNPRTPTPDHASANANAPPLYISFCTFRI